MNLKKTKFILSGLLAIALLITGCKDKQTSTPSFIINDSKIISWKANEDSYSVRLTDQAAKEIEILTTKNLNKPFSVYLDNFLVSTPVIRTPISSSTIVLFGNDAEMERIHQLLPKDKEKQ